MNEPNDPVSDPLAGHLDLDDLADLLAGDQTHRSHVSQCERCRAELDRLEQAMPAVASALAGLPLPAAPADLEQRWNAAPHPRPVTDLASRRQSRWSRPLAVSGGLAAAAALVFAGVTVFHSDKPKPATSADSAGRVAGGSPQISSTGSDYRKDGTLLAQELPALLAGSAAVEVAGGAAPAAPGPSTFSGDSKTPSGALAAVVDPLQRLRTTAGLAGCIAALTDPADTSLPLALDYASFEGQPALVVVLSSSKAGKVDVFIVGAACAPADAALLHFARLDKP